MSSTKEIMPIKISRKKTANSTKKSHKNLNSNNNNDNSESIIKNEEFIAKDFDEENDDYMDFEEGDIIYVKLIKYGKEFYLLSDKDLVYTVPGDMYFENEYLFNNRLTDYFRPEESNVYFLAGKKKKR